MKESLVKLVLILVGLASLVVGATFLAIPGWVANYTGITSTDLAWLRGVGASTVGLQGFGLCVAAFRRRDTNPLLGTAGFVTTVQGAIIWYALFAGEFGEMSRWAVVAVAILTTVGAGLVWIAWISRRRSVVALPQKGRKQVGGAPSSVDVNDPQADLVEEIDGQSPRLSE